MTIYRFARCRFDVRSLELLADGRPIALRPKAARILQHLLDNAGRVVRKRDLLNAAWGTHCVRDQTLFQTVSELRRRLAPLEPIKTHPNLGYQWTEPVTTGPRWLPTLFAVGLTGLAGALWLFHSAAIPRAHADSNEAMSPALRAFATGVALLDGRRPGDAARYFQLAAHENPGFAEARLLRAEALLAAGEAEAAQAVAEALVRDRSIAEDPYTTVSALGLLSRSDWQLGRHDAALSWALAAMARSRASGLACAASDNPVDAAALPVPRQSPLTTQDAGPTEAMLRLADAMGLPSDSRCQDVAPPLHDSSAPAPDTTDRQPHAYCRPASQSTTVQSMA